VAAERYLTEMRRVYASTGPFLHGQDPERTSAESTHRGFRWPVLRWFSDRIWSGRV